MVAASNQEPHPQLDTLSMRRLEERFRTEIVVAERWSDAYRAERELRRAQALLQGLRGSTSHGTLRPSTNTSQRSLLNPLEHTTLPTLRGASSMSYMPLQVNFDPSLPPPTPSLQTLSLDKPFLPTSSAGARISGGWMGPHTEILKATHYYPDGPTRRPATREERHLVRRVRRELRQQRADNAAGPRPVPRLTPIRTGVEFPAALHFPRSSLPEHYGHSLHHKKSVTGIDTREMTK